MKLTGSNLHDIEFHMLRAKEMKREDAGIRISLGIYPEKNIDEVKADLKNYNVSDIEYFKIINAIYAKVPAKNLRKVVESGYVKKFEWPGYVETLSTSRGRYPSVGLLTGPPAPKMIKVLDEKPPTEDKIVDLTKS